MSQSIAFILFLFLLAGAAPQWLTWASLVIGMGGFVSLPWVTWHDRRVRLVRLVYVLDPLGDKVQEGLRAVARGVRAHAIPVWAVHHEHNHGDWKRNAGAGTSVGRRRVQIGWGAPSIIQTNARVGFLDIEGVRLYLFPDRLLIFGRGGVSAARYPDLNLTAGRVQFREEGGVPRDANVIGTTWRYVNKDGGPDRRFNNNYQIPIALYGTARMSAPSGMQLSLQTSNEDLAPSSVELLHVVAAAVRELESRHAADPRLDSLPTFADDPPPLLLPGAAALRTAGHNSLLPLARCPPEWAKPVVWGILFALPPVALIFRFAHGGAGANVFVSSAFTAAGAGIGILLFCAPPPTS